MILSVLTFAFDDTRIDGQTIPRNSDAIRQALSEEIRQQERKDKIINDGNYSILNPSEKQLYNKCDHRLFPES